MDFYQEAKQFAKEHIEPYTRSSDEESRFPVESFEEMGKAGYFKLLIPEEMGGLGKTAVEHQQAVMAFAESNPTAGLCYMMHNVALMTVLNEGNEELKKRVVNDIIENNVFMALAYSEFGTGTHFYIPEVKVEKKENGEYVFNGVKSMVTSATHASYYLILTPSTEKEGAINNWIVPIDSEGLEFKMEHWKGIGMRGNVSCPMQINGVTLPEENRIGEEGSGEAQVFNIVAPYFILGLASVYAGLNLRLSNVTNDYALNRKYPDGSNLANIETVQVHLAKIYSNALSSKAITELAARSLVDGEEDAVAKIIAARVCAIERAIESSNLAMRVGGGKTYNRMSEIERLMRDAYAGQIMAPSLDILNVWLGRAITGQPLL